MGSTPSVADPALVAEPGRGPEVLAAGGGDGVFDDGGVHRPATPAAGSTFEQASATEPVRDDRSPGKRRVDALMELLGAGARATAGDGVQSGAATVLLTMGLADLRAGHGATTTTGDVLDAGAARRFACTADLIPAVLGGPSQPLDVGRRERLATKAIRAAAILRDGGCTFPGCDRPPGFCETHHIQPWWTGGETSLANSALLCSRHHQIVHRHGYTADIAPDGVHWDLTPGSCPATTPQQPENHASRTRSAGPRLAGRAAESVDRSPCRPLSAW